MKTVFTVAILGALLLATAITSYIVMQEITDIPLSLHGMIAMGLGIVFTIGIGVGLMWLVFYSARSGHDQSAHGDERE
ncbi:MULTISPECIES: hypothetical protein [unclassified Iodidimonas]|jgi:predicted lysophospholipase L1 biosynthesis ABC-type transport system permease subunit|uniref:hypothetical protein n=1 Tax=unclassified Iodidimonas TaxID=2626145 RepID=UPI002482E33A|nr:MULTISPECIES: hypothetical protein [unclassified Iodidimonas]